MEELSDCAVDIIEFPTSSNRILVSEYEEISVGTEPLPKPGEKAVETNRKVNVETQTEYGTVSKVNYDEKKLASWLKRICPLVESELLKGPTPLSESHGLDLNSTDENEMTIQTYRNISLPFRENSQGLATWLSIYTNNTPALVLAISTTHDSWCEHVDQVVKVFIPKRMHSGRFVAFQELKSMPTKACLSNLSTNPFDKDMFAGSTVSSDLYIWKFISNKSQGDVQELDSVTLEHGSIVALDWPNVDRLLTCHANGRVCLWVIGNHLIKENEYLIKGKHKEVLELSTLICVSLTDFVVGCYNGDLYYCSSNNIGPYRNDIEMTEMKGHQFTVSSLLKRTIGDKRLIISCDLSGEVFYHDLANLDEDGPTVILKIPLPFQNNITCSKDGKILFCPGINGALEIYRVANGRQTRVKGVLQGRGNVIKLSDNEHWIVTGAYGGDFQIYKLLD